MKLLPPLGGPRCVLFHDGHPLMRAVGIVAGARRSLVLPAGGRVARCRTIRIGQMPGAGDQTQPRVLSWHLPMRPLSRDRAVNVRST